MSNRTYFFPTQDLEMQELNFPRLNAPCYVPSHEDYIRERTAQAKYPAAMLAELFAAGEITREQYDRLRRERA